MEDIRISRSSLVSYLGIDKREGLVRIGKRLLRGMSRTMSVRSGVEQISTDVETGNLTVSWQKSFHEDDVMRRENGSSVMALSAFLLSSLPTHVDRKMLVKEMWDSGAEVMVRSGQVTATCATHHIVPTLGSHRP